MNGAVQSSLQQASPVSREQGVPEPGPVGEDPVLGKVQNPDPSGYFVFACICGKKDQVFFHDNAVNILGGQM